VGLNKEHNLSPFSRQDILNYVGCHVKCVVFSDFNQNWNMLTNFYGCPKCDLSCHSLQTDGRTQGW